MGEGLGTRTAHCLATVRRIVLGPAVGALAVGALAVGGSLVGAAVVGGSAGASPVSGPTVSARSYTAFGDPRPVDIEGYSVSAMEPFIAPDGRTLLFNTSNVAPNIPSLQYASLAGAGVFAYRGPILGANLAGYLSGTPTVDRQGDLFFVSTRKYAQTGSTIYSGTFRAGRVRGLHLVPGITAPSPGLVYFDVDVSLDGSRLYASLGRFAGGSGPVSAELVVYDRMGRGFVPDRQSARLLAAVNRAGTLTYAAAISADGRELFFTQGDPDGGVPMIERAVRSNRGQPFGPGTPIGAITGFAEAPSISADGTTLYYHRLVGTTFEIERVTRALVDERGRSRPDAVTRRPGRPGARDDGARSGPSRPAASAGR
jgi:hypothetical protein